MNSHPVASHFFIGIISLTHQSIPLPLTLPFLLPSLLLLLLSNPPPSSQWSAAHLQSPPRLYAAITTTHQMLSTPPGTDSDSRPVPMTDPQLPNHPTVFSTQHSFHRRPSFLCIRAKSTRIDSFQSDPIGNHSEESGHA